MEPFAGFLFLRKNDNATTIPTLVAYMKRLRILPGAAGVIALTATIGFVDGKSKIEPESFSRGRITLVRTLTHITADGALLDNQLAAKPDIPVYLVEISRGSLSAKVLIDGASGQILLSRTIPS